MITYTTGNLLEANVDALVNTVNTVGVMGKGIALMFKEEFPHNMRAYKKACKAGDVVIGKMFVTNDNHEENRPKWIINFPTKEHWRHKSKLEWIEAGLHDLKKTIIDKNIKSIAIPALGAGNGGLEWLKVKSLIESNLKDLDEVRVIVFEPSDEYFKAYHHSAKHSLTPARAMILELIRRYWILGMECSLLEIQKLSWFLQRALDIHKFSNVLDLNFKANYYGPYANRLQHLLNGLDGSYLNSTKRIPDLSPLEVVYFNYDMATRVKDYLNNEALEYQPVLDFAVEIINGFESPFGMELLSTVDWLIQKEGCVPELESIKKGIDHWPAGSKWAERKKRIFDDRSIQIALDQLIELNMAHAITN